jgi:hypothetical protein
MKKLMVAAALLFSVSLAAKQFKYNFAWDWSMPRATHADITKMLGEMKKMGFNIYVSSETGEQLDWVFEEAAKLKMDVYLVMDFKAGGVYPEGSEQVISDADTEKLIAKAKRGKNFNDQVGGEPVDSNDIFSTDMVCFDHPEALAAAKAQAKKLAGEKRAAGIAFDWFGYKNYYGCYCDLSSKAEDTYEKAHKELDPDKAMALRSLDALVNFMNAVIDEARAARPDIKFTCHVYPYFKPEPLYGNRLNIEYPEQTVSWFFKPFWDLKKVEEYAKVVVKNEKFYFKDGVGIPFMGIYADENLKPAKRVEEEFTIIKNQGAEGISVASFGDILKDPGLTRVFSNWLVK